MYYRCTAVHDERVGGSVGEMGDGSMRRRFGVGAREWNGWMDVGGLECRSRWRCCLTRKCCSVPPLMVETKHWYQYMAPKDGVP